MSADKYKVTFMENDKNSIFALNMENNKGEQSSGEIYYFNKNEQKRKKIENLSGFNSEKKNFHIIVYDGRDLEYYKPLKDKTINDANLLNKLNEYDKCVIINITDNGYKNTYIFLREQSKISTDGKFEKMKIENEETFKKGNLIDIVRALFNLIEDYHINIDGVKKKEPARQEEDQAAAAATATAGEEAAATATAGEEAAAAKKNEEAAEEVTKRTVKQDEEEVQNMRPTDIKDELVKRGIPYVEQAAATATAEEEAAAAKKNEEAAEEVTKRTVKQDEDEVQNMRPTDIKDELVKRGIPYEGLIEKSDFEEELVIARKREREGHGTFAKGARVVLHGMTQEAYNGLVGTVTSDLGGERLGVKVDKHGTVISVKPVNMQLTRLSNISGGKRKYKANVNQKSLKKMSTIIKKLLKINLNIKPVAKPTAKPKAKPTAKPKAKPTAKPAAKPTAKPKAKPTAKPAAKPTAKPAAKPVAKPKAKPAAKPKAKPTAKPKAKPVAKPKAKPTAKPKAKPAAKPKAKPTAKPKAKPTAKPKAKK